MAGGFCSRTSNAVIAADKMSKLRKEQPKIVTHCFLMILF